MTAHLPPPAPDATPDFLRYQRERDLAALQQALMSCAPVLLRTARRHSVDEAEDLVHETFAVAIRRADDFTAGGRLLPWLLGILENCARARTRRRWSRLRFGHDGALDEEANDDPLPPAVVERREWIARAVASVRALPEPYRDVVAGHLLDGEALTELSTRLGRPASTVRTQLQRGLVELRRRLPAPLLAGFVALLATRRGPAGTVALPRRPAMRPALLAVTVAVAVVVATFALLWSLHTDGAVPPPIDATPAAASVAPATATRPPSDQRIPIETPAPAAPKRTVAVELHLADALPAVGVPLILVPGFRLNGTAARYAARWRTAATDAQGRVVFGDVPPGPTGLLLHDSGLLDTFVVGDEPLEFTFDVQLSGTYRLRVHHPIDGPIAGAEVFARSPSGNTPGYAIGVTDADGLLRVALPLSTVRFWATAPGFVPRRTQLVMSTGVLDVQDHDIEVARASKPWSGRVVDPDGVPLPDTDVIVWTGRSAGPPPRYDVTDRDGRFSFEGDDGDWAAGAFREGYAYTTAGVDAGGTIDLQLRRGGTCHGRIVDLPPDAGRFGWITRHLAARPGDPLNGASGLVEPNGEFELRDLPLGEHDLSLIRRGSQPVSVGTLHVTADRPSRIDVPYLHIAPWPVRVVDDAGKPIVNCLVHTESVLPRVGQRYQQQAATDAAGVAQLAGGAAGEHTLHVHLPLPGGHNRLAALHSGPLPAGRPVDLVMPRTAAEVGSIRGRMRPEWLTTKGALLELHCRDGGSATIPATIDGNFAIDGVPPGTYRVRYWQEYAQGSCRFVLAVCTVAPGATVDLGDLAPQPFGHAAITIPRPATAAALPYVLRNAAGELVEHGEAAPGAVLERDLLPGRYAFEFLTADGRTGSAPFTIEPAATSRAVVTRTAAAVCRVVVRATHTPAVQAGILGSIGGGDGEAFEFLLRPTGDGRSWQIEFDLVPGHYRFTARTPWDAAIDAVIEVTAAGGRALEFVLP